MARVAIACGGSGGHLIPGIAVAQELTEQGHEVLLIISRKAIDKKVLSAHPEFNYVALPAVGWPGFSYRIIFFIKGMIDSLNQCEREFKTFKPDAVLGMGGFTCIAPLLKGSWKKIPTYLHESNVVPGRATYLLRKRVSKVLLGYKECARLIPETETVVTGTPVKKELKSFSWTEAGNYWQLDPSRKTIAVLGGSQAATGVNRMMVESLPNWKRHKESWQVIHLSGSADEGWVRDAYKKHGWKAAVRPFCEKMAYVYNFCHLVVGRAGASTLAEVCHFGVPSVLVPYPFADGHQRFNAQVMERSGASQTVLQNSHGVENLSRVVEKLLTDENACRELEEGARKLSTHDAPQRIVEEVLGD